MNGELQGASSHTLIRRVRTNEPNLKAFYARKKFNAITRVHDNQHNAFISFAPVIEFALHAPLPLPPSLPAQPSSAQVMSEQWSIERA
jgi:hypothetical protein